VVGSAPLVDTEMLVAFRDSVYLKDSLKKSFNKMLWFYGLKQIYDENGDSQVDALRLALTPANILHPGA